MPKYLIIALGLLLGSCSNESKTADSKEENSEVGIDYNPHSLPDDLSNISEDELTPILPMLGDARIIGISEGTHEFIEPIQFRNELLKFLIEKKRIHVIGLESGLIESKLVNDYVHGKNVPIDSVLNYGLVCNFGKINLNRDLLEWVREYNQEVSVDDMVSIYGYDIPGCAPNPITENSRSGINYILNFLRTDSAMFDKYTSSLDPYMPMLHIKDNPESKEPHFWDIDSTQWDDIFVILDELESDLELSKSEYIKEVGEDEVMWAFAAVKGAKQNMDYLRSIGNPAYDYSPRELGQLENLEWILKKEEGKNIAAFAHIGHLAKEIHMNNGGMSVPMGGEHIAEEHGDNYVVIGNFYRKLDWFDGDPLVLEDSLIANQLKKEGIKNFYMAVNKTDTLWNKEWPFGKPSSGGQVYMNPAQAVDIFLYNDVQTWLYHYQEDE